MASNHNKKAIEVDESVLHDISSPDEGEIREEGDGEFKEDDDGEILCRNSDDEKECLDERKEDFDITEPEEIKNNNNGGVKTRWFHRFRRAKLKGQTDDGQRENTSSEKKDATIPGDDVCDAEALKFHKKNRWKIFSSKENQIPTQEISNNEEHPIENSKNFKTMEALGIYGLLTPAMAAVPSTDEFDTVHKQIKTELGEDWELRLAAAHVDDALSGRGKHGKARSYFRPKFAQTCFKILDNIWYRRFFLLIILVHAMMIFIEPPSCSVESVHFMVYVTMAICLLIYLADLVMRVQFHSWRIFWSNETEEGYWNWAQFLIVCAFWVDFIILCISVLIEKYLPQIFRCLRLVMLLCRIRSIRHIFEVLAIIGTSLLKVLFIILVFIITFACIGVHLFMDTYNKSFQKSANSSQSDYCCVDADKEEKMYIGAFDNVGIAILRLFVLLSTENYPEIMLPALRRESVNFFYFGTFVFFGGFFLTAILLAIVVDSYWVFAKKTIKKERARERTELAKAWNLLDPLGLGALSVHDKQFIDLFRLLKPKNTEEQNVMLIHLLDSQGDGEIDSFEWTTTQREALNAEFEEDEEVGDEDTESKFMTKVRKKAQSLVESDVFSKLFLCLILLHGFLFCLKWKGQPEKCEAGIHGIRTGVTVIFLFEIAIRIAALGKKIFRLLEIIDVTAVFIAVTFNCVYYAEKSKDFKEICVTISSLAVIVRWLLTSSGTRKAFRWFLNIVPVMFDLVVLLFVILYLLATVAMELFHSYPIPVSNQIYPDSCKLGFKDFWCSFMMMFQTLTTSNWHEIMNLVYAETKNTVAYFFFPLSYLIITMIVMNLFVAIAIEAANKLTSKRSESTAYSMHQSTIDSTADAKPRPTFNETAKKILASVAKSVLGSARVEETQDRNNRQAINSPISTSTMTLKGTRKGSTTIILSPPSSKRDSNKRRQSKAEHEVADENRNEVVDNDEDDDEDYPGLSPKAKREKQLKNRMKKKRRARQKTRKTSATVLDRVQQQVRAIASFRGCQPTDLDFMVGDTITVIATRDEWMQGECKGVTGWFPASHVVNWSAKVLHESRASLKGTTPKGNDTIVVNEVAVSSYDTQTRPITPKNDTENDTAIIAKKQQSSLAPQPNYRIKLKSGDWRREILGDMTVMNAEEMRELNKVMRAELRAPGSRGSKANMNRKPIASPSLSRREIIPVVEEISAAEQYDYQLREGTVENLKRSRAGTNPMTVFTTDSPNLGQRSATVDTDLSRTRSDTGSSLVDNLFRNDDGNLATGKRFPTVSISQLSHMEFPSQSESVPDERHSEAPHAPTDGVGAKNYLAIDVPEEKTQEKKKKKEKTGEMPEWAKKFAETKNISVQNVTFPEPSLEDGSLPGSVNPKLESE